MDIKVNQDTVLVFDLDDTLYNELDYLKSAYKAIALHLEPKNWKKLYANMFSLYRSNTNVFKFLVGTYDITLSALIELYQNHKPTIEVFEGVINVLNNIKSRNGKIAIITDGRSKTQRAKLESLGILKYVDHIVISEEIGSEKPHPANFSMIEDILPASKYYYIADNLKKDFITPNLRGWKSIGLIDNGKNIHFQSHNYLTVENEPTEYILSFHELNII